MTLIVWQNICPEKYNVAEILYLYLADIYKGIGQNIVLQSNEKKNLIYMCSRRLILTQLLTVCVSKKILPQNKIFTLLTACGQDM